MNAFYALLRKWLGGKEYTSQLITKEEYNARVNFLLRVNEGDTDCREGFLTGNTNAYNWLKRYHVYKYADDSAVLVLCPKKIGAIDVTKMPLSSLQQPTYAEQLFIDLWKIHQADHCKGVTFLLRLGQAWQGDKGRMQAIHGCMPPLYWCYESQKANCWNPAFHNVWNVCSWSDQHNRLPKYA
jgi:hypothetical protein